MDKERKPTRNSKLREIRKKAKLTQFGLAQAIGVTETSVHRWEKGKTPFPHQREKLCDLFGKTTADLGLINNPEGNNNEKPNGRAISSPHPRLTEEEIRELFFLRNRGTIYDNKKKGDSSTQSFTLTKEEVTELFLLRKKD